MANRATRRKAAKLAKVEAFDGFAPLRNGLRRIAEKTGEWAGIPMPIEDQPLVIEPSYPNAATLMAIGKKPDQDDDEDGARIVNRFWSAKLHSDVVIWEKNAKREWGIAPGCHHLEHDMMTLGASDVWGIEQEMNAQELLASLIRHRQMKQYLLTGMFLESSPRSQILYMFRRLKPTVAISTRTGKTRILAALCLHPIAYYQGSWAGAMCPTDDVVAHLMLMRGDEPMFWRRANHHAPFRPEAGL